MKIGTETEQIEKPKLKTILYVFRVWFSEKCDCLNFRIDRYPTVCVVCAMCAFVLREVIYCRLLN